MAVFSEQGNLSFCFCIVSMVKLLCQERAARPCGRAAIPVAALLSPRGAHPSGGFTVLAGAWGQPSPRGALLSVSSHQCGCTGVGVLWRDTPKTPHPAGAAWAGQGVRLSLWLSIPAAGAALGLCREQVWAVLRLPAPASTRPTPAARHEQLRLASWESW